MSDKITVKPLVWTEARIGEYEISACAETSIGRYEAWYFRLRTVPARDCYGWSGPGGTKDKSVPGYDEARAAAQADYEQRILSAIDTSALTASQEEVKRMETAIGEAMSDMRRCVHDGGFDREIGPIGCTLGDKCVCIGIFPTLAEALEASNALKGEGK